jgi:hypothetical protein
MDTSETYIKMCEKAIEIQTMKVPVFLPRKWAPKKKEEEEGAFIDGDYVWVVRESLSELYILGGDGYYIYQREGEEIEISSCGYCDGGIEDKFDKLIWLPRQDQLQEMIYKDDGLQSICWLAYEYSTGRCSGITINGTLEQLWLGIVMSEKYNKAWNGDNWV